MAKARIIVHLECESCKQRNYSLRVSKKRAYEKLNLKKFCEFCRQHKAHKEIK
ncbi:TPA: 50S ribosomal protein L33 [Candidatus Dependentiae bacterium]|nr:50S ribosomal protein L33 [Candidatus Dependentiae bacterium]HBZ72950.1 50S ribosomal protein L33 [Candidatus Dependentiae bacterium]